MTRLERDDIISGLRELVVRAHAAGITGARVHIVGGAALRLAYFDRPATRDIDARIQPADALQPIVEGIGVERGWDTDWLNGDAVKFIPGYGAAVNWLPLHHDEHVSIWVAPTDTLLAMKLKAIEGRRGRDEDDVAHLLAITGITTADEAEKLLDSFFPGDALNERALATLESIMAKGLPVVPPAPPLPELDPGDD